MPPRRSNQQKEPPPPPQQQQQNRPGVTSSYRVLLTARQGSPFGTMIKEGDLLMTLNECGPVFRLEMKGGICIATFKSVAVVQALLSKKELLINGFQCQVKPLVYGQVCSAPQPPWPFSSCPCGRSDQSPGRPSGLWRPGIGREEAGGALLKAVADSQEPAHHGDARGEQGHPARHRDRVAVADLQRLDAAARAAWHRDAAAAADQLHPAPADPEPAPADQAPAGRHAHAGRPLCHEALRAGHLPPHAAAALLDVHLRVRARRHRLHRQGGE